MDLVPNRILLVSILVVFCIFTNQVVFSCKAVSRLEHHFLWAQYVQVFVGGNRIQNKAIATIERRLGFSFLFDVEMPYKSSEEINIAVIEFLSLFM
jgi:hypothetical protein